MIGEQQVPSEVTTVNNFTKVQVKEQLITVLKVLSIKSPSNQQLSVSHKTIADLMKEQSFFDGLIESLIQFQQSEDHPNISMLAITTLSTYLRNQQSRGTLIKKQDKYTLNKKLIQTYMRQDIEESYRLLLIKQYLQFIYAPGMETIRGQTIESICNSFSLIIANLEDRMAKDEHFFLKEDFKNINKCIPLAQILLKGPIEHIHMKNIVRNFYKTVCLLANNAITRLQQTIRQLNQPLFIKISYIALNLITFFKQLVLFSSNDSLYLVKLEIMKDEKLRDIVISTLLLSINPKPSQQTLTEVVVESHGNKYVERINQMKKNCVEVIDYFCRLVLKHKSEKETSKQEYAIPLSLIQFFISNVPTILIQQFETLQYPQRDPPNKELYKVIMKTMANTIRINKFYNQSAALRSSILFRLCLPLLQRKQTDQITSAANYKRVREDILNMHSLDVTQNAVCKVLESYVDKIDGSLLFITTHIYNMIEFQLTANPNVFSKLPVQFTQSYFFKNADYLIQIECGLTAIALLSYMAPGREDIVELIEQLFISRQPFLFNHSNPGTLKCAVMLCYTYYVDNFYLNLVENKSNRQNFHIKVIQYCSEYIRMFTSLSADSELDRKQMLSLEIGALQALDCLNNCITQKNFIKALFWSEGGWSQAEKQQRFLSIFQFLLNQLNFSMNITVIDALIQFYTQNIKNQCDFGSSIKRFHYQYKGVPVIIREQLSNLVCHSIYGIYSNHMLPNKELMKNKIMHFLQIVMTCCETPDLFMNPQFFSLEIEKNHYWDVMGFMDIYVRRMVAFKNQNRQINTDVLEKILAACINIFPEIKEELKFRCIFGILLNLIALNEQIIDRMVQPLGKLLIDLLQEEQQGANYIQELQTLIEKTAYINMIAIFTRFNENNQLVWCELVSFLQGFLERRSTRGIIAARSSPYIGKLLTICLVCLFHMRNTDYLDPEKAKIMWKNILRNSQIYISLSEKQIAAATLIKLLTNRNKISENDEECEHCLKFISLLLYQAFSSAFAKSIRNEDRQEDNSSSSQVDGSEGEAQKLDINYREYTMNKNECMKNQSKQKSILEFKALCHALKEQSPQFLKTTIERLSLPIQNFVKQQVYYFQGNVSEQGMRKLLKVKK